MTQSQFKKRLRMRVTMNTKTDDVWIRAFVDWWATPQPTHFIESIPLWSLLRDYWCSSFPTLQFPVFVHLNEGGSCGQRTLIAS